MQSIITTRTTTKRHWLGVLAFALAIAAPAARAESAAGTSHAQASIDMRIVIPAFVRTRSQSDPAEVPIGEADIVRGYVDLDEATSLVLTSNSSSGFMVSVAFDERLVSRVVVRIDGRVLEAAAPGEIHVPSRKVVDKPMRVGYRLFLAPSASAGVHRWPVMLRFAPTAV
ncbi:MAG TPA: hypothetical protein VI363_05870 [Burkholderiales bacterium]